VVRSLGPDLVRAGHLAQDLDRRLDALFGLADEGLVTDAKAVIRRLVDDWLAQKLEEDRDERAFDPGAYEDESLDGLNDVRTIEAEALAEGDLHNALADAQALVEGAGVAIEGEDLHRLAFELQRARVRALKLIVEDREADLLGLERVQVGQGDRVAPPQPEKPAAPTVQELGERFIRDRVESNAWKSEKIRDKDGPREVQRVVDFLGPDRQIDEVTTDDMEAYRSHLLATVAESTAGQRMRGFPAAMFNFAVSKGWIDRSPATGVTVKVDVQQEKRHPFSDADLCALFHAGYADACMTPQMAEHGLPIRGAPKVFSAARYYVPLMGLFVGGRLGELVLIRVEDITEGVGGLWVKLWPEEGGRLKTSGSWRDVPLHTHLVGHLGLGQYVEERREAGERHLFDCTRLGRPSHHVGDWFSSYKLKRGITSPKKTLHSTRHNWASALTSAGVPSYIIDALGGWADRSMSTGRYGSHISAEARREAIERLDFSDILRDLPAMKER
jgi:integrase